MSDSYANRFCFVYELHIKTNLVENFHNTIVGIK